MSDCRSQELLLVEIAYHGDQPVDEHRHYLLLALQPCDIPHAYARRIRRL